MKEILVYRFEQIIYAPIEVVFDYVNDDEKILKWNTMLVENIYEPNHDKLQQGTRFTSVQQIEKKNVSIDTVIVEYEAPHTIIMESKTKEGLSTTRYFLSRDYDGTILVVESSIIPSNFFYFMLTKLFGWASKYVFEEQFMSLKNMVENEPEDHETVI